MLVVDGVNKTFRTSRVRVEAVQDVSFAIGRGETVALLGPNGAGKSTLLKIITGLVRPDSGSIAIDGEDPARRRSAMQRVGAVLEGNRNVYWRLSAIENLDYFGALKNVPRHTARERGLRHLGRLGLSEKANELASRLSRGMQQKLAIATALIHDPAWLLLDEPTLGLDVEATVDMKAMLKALKGEGKGIILTTHQLDIAQELADRVLLIRGGRIILQEATPALLARHAKERYTVRLQHAASAELAASLRALDASVNVTDERIEFRSDPALLYRVLAVTAPEPVRSVELDEPQLEEVFLRMVRGESGARAAPAPEADVGAVA